MPSPPKNWCDQGGGQWRYISEGAFESSLALNVYIMGVSFAELYNIYE